VGVRQQKTARDSRACLMAFEQAAVLFISNGAVLTTGTCTTRYNQLYSASAHSGNRYVTNCCMGQLSATAHGCRILGSCPVFNKLMNEVLFTRQTQLVCFTQCHHLVCSSTAKHSMTLLNNACMLLHRCFWPG
jgi:hypothetical protein